MEVLHRYHDRISYWASEKDRGPAHAINKGLDVAKGEVVAWLNSDDMISSDALWEIGKAFAEDSDLDMIFANAIYKMKTTSFIWLTMAATKQVYIMERCNL